MSAVHAALREPLLHFAVIGAAIFAAWAWLGVRPGEPRAASPALRIDASQVEWLQRGFERQWHRPPTAAETRGLVADLLREQLLAREALSLDLDVDDTVVRRRLAQKMRFVVEDTLRLAEPTDDELRRHYEANAAQFGRRERRSFEHLYFSGHRRRDPAADARAALPLAARDPVAAARLADPTLAESAVADADETDVAGRFGPAFARAVFALPAGEWHGAIESGFGYHLVRVTEVAPPSARDFAAVREQVLEHWRGAQQRAAMQRYFAGLLARHRPSVDESVRALIGGADAGELVAAIPDQTAAPR
jgi:hypothetical protein